ncbi:MAG: tetratricopeptide repeat protein [Promethearchaeota archaeon]
MRNKAKGLSIVLFLSVFIMPISCQKQKAEWKKSLDLYTNISYFTGGISKRPFPKTELLKEPSNSQIAKMCITGASLEELKKLDIQDLDKRLDILIKGHVLNLVNARYSLSFPAIIGKEREIITDIVNKASKELSPLVESMIALLGNKLKDKQNILFHLLWSRVIDEIWSAAWKLAFPAEELPDVIWVIYPEHPFAVGTNYQGLPGNSDVAMTWSNKCTDHLSLFDKFRFELQQAAWKKEIKDQKAKEQMKDFGAFDASGNFTIFSYKRGDSLHQILNNMISEYASKVSNIFDYKKLGLRFNIHYADIFVIIHHETAYAIFENLYKTGKLNIPDILLYESDKRDFSSLISIELGNPPSLSDEAMALFMRNNWRGNQEIVERFKQVLMQDSSNLDILFYLGLSLYDIKEYYGAIDTFQKLIKFTGGSVDHTLKFDWSHIWIGHIYDVLGERDKAISFYKKALTSKDTTSKLQMSQYNIGPINAKEWAKQRIEEPFKRK